MSSWWRRQATATPSWPAHRSKWCAACWRVRSRETPSRSSPPEAWGRALMKRLAERSGGLTTRINPDESIGWRTFELSGALDAPRLLDVKVAEDKGRLTFLSGTPTLVQGEELWAVTRMEDGQELP